MQLPELFTGEAILNMCFLYHVLATAAAWDKLIYIPITHIIRQDKKTKLSEFYLHSGQPNHTTCIASTVHNTANIVHTNIEQCTTSLSYVNALGHNMKLDAYDRNKMSKIFTMWLVYLHQVVVSKTTLLTRFILEIQTSQ